MGAMDTNKKTPRCRGQSNTGAESALRDGVTQGCHRLRRVGAAGETRRGGGAGGGMGMVRRRIGRPGCVLQLLRRAGWRARSGATLVEGDTRQTHGAAHGLVLCAVESGAMRTSPSSNQLQPGLLGWNQT